MTDLSTGTVYTANDRTVNNNSAADTGSQCDHDTVLTSLAAAFPHLTKGSYICIISYFYRQTDFLRKCLCHIECTPSEIDTFTYDAVIFNRTRNTDSDTLYLVFADTGICQFAF